MNPDQSPWRYAVNIGLIGALITVMLSLIGMVEAFSKRDIIYKVVTMGHILLLLSAVFLSYLAAKKTGRDQTALVFGTAVLTGVMTAAGIERRLKGIQKRGGKVVLVDPRRTETAALADEHYFIQPGTDILLLLAMVQVVLAKRLTDPGRLVEITNGLDSEGLGTLGQMVEYM